MNLTQGCFAIIASYLSDKDPVIHIIRKLAGSVEHTYIDTHGYSRKNGFLHSQSGKPAVIKDTLRIWYLDGKVHRDNDLPAVIHEGNAYWFYQGQLHRENAPAIIKKHIEIYYDHGKRVSDSSVTEKQKCIELLENSKKRRKYRERTRKDTYQGSNGGNTYHRFLIQN